MQRLHILCDCVRATHLILLSKAEICAVKRFACKFDKIAAMCLYMIFAMTQFDCTLFETM